MSVPLEPVLTVPTVPFTIHVWVVLAVDAALVIVNSVRTVPDPHPLTVHSLILKFCVGVWVVPVAQVPLALISTHRLSYSGIQPEG